MVKVYSGDNCILTAREAENETIAGFLMRNGLSESLYMPCGGEGLCGKCRVSARGELSEPDEREVGLEPGFRLACRAKILGDCEIVLEKRGYIFEERAGFKSSGNAVAVDIGTTTLFCALVDTERGEVVKTVATVNPQAEFGSDVISRIHAISKDKTALTKQTSLIRTAVSKAVRELTDNTDAIEKITVVGNTVMEYIFCGKNPEPLGQYPFETEDISGLFKATDFDIDCKNASLEITPFLSAFFGSDALYGAALLLENDGDMLLDMGTNGEICVRQNGSFNYCSAAAGPAFEGAGLSFGCAAVDGAVCRVTEEDGEIHCESLGGAKPCGFCGSGIIDALKVMLDTGICTSDGRLTATDGKYTAVDGNGRLIFKPISDSDISVNGADIRALQLAKSAVCTAVRLCAGDIKTVRRLYLSGGFGDKINISSAVRCGIIPRELEKRAVPAGNSALSGAVRSLTERAFSKKVEYIRKNSRLIDLNEIEEFNDLFAEYISFDDR